MDYTWTNLGELTARLLELLSKRHPYQVAELRATLHGDTLVLEGQVASEACKGDAKRFALSLDRILKVRNMLEVAAFLEAASDPSEEDGYFDDGPSRRSAPPSRRGRSTLPYPDRYTRLSPRSPGVMGMRRMAGRIEGPGVEYGSVQESPSSGPVHVERYPRVESTGEIAPDRVIEVVVDLSSSPEPGDDAIALGSFAADWSTIEISVQLAAEWVCSVEALEPCITLRRDGPALPARFRCTVAKDHVAGSAAVLMVYFLHGTRICGHIARDLAPASNEAASGPEAGADDAMVSPRAASGDPQSGASSFRVVPDAAGPTLSVMISRLEGDRQLWAWKAFGFGQAATGSESIGFNGTSQAFADSLLASCPDLVRGEFRRRMSGIGELIWRASPQGFRECYARCRSRLGTGFPIQFLTDDPFVPWEMMKPDMDAGGIDHLYIEHPVARWPLNGAGPLRSEFPTGAILSFVPDYPVRPLKAAAKESVWICAELAATKMPPTREAFLDMLDGKLPDRVRLIHFAGHGQVDTGANDGGIELEDAPVGLLDVYQSTVRIGSSDGPLLVLNACETSAGAEFLGMNAGWGAAIAAREFGGLIAPLWAVQDAVAFTMVKDTLPELVAGRATLGAALTAARTRNADDAVAVLAYLAHGDVMASFATS